MTGFNRATIVGNLGQDPDVRRMPNGDPVASLRIATNETWRDKNSGEKKESVEWHSVVIFGKLCEVVEKYLHKGSKVLVEGKLKTRMWEKDGVKRYTTEIVLTGFGGTLVMLDSKGDRPPPASESDYGGGGASKPLAEELNDEIPFASQHPFPNRHDHA